MALPRGAGGPNRPRTAAFGSVLKYGVAARGHVHHNLFGVGVRAEVLPLLRHAVEEGARMMGRLAVSRQNLRECVHFGGCGLQETEERDRILWITSDGPPCKGCRGFPSTPPDEENIAHRISIQLRQAPQAKPLEDGVLDHERIQHSSQ